MEKLAERNPVLRVEIELLRELVDLHHTGVGRVTFKYSADFPGAQWGNFIWLDEERTSPHEEPFNDALVFINTKFRDDRTMRRIIGAKELMHVFDEEHQRTKTAAEFRRLINEIADKPVREDTSPQYEADRWALWKAIIALIPPWIRVSHLPAWRAGDLKAPELAAKLWLPEGIVASAMGDYYETMCGRFGVRC